MSWNNQNGGPWGNAGGGSHGRGGQIRGAMAPEAHSRLIWKM